MGVPDEWSSRGGLRPAPDRTRLTGRLELFPFRAGRFVLRAMSLPLRARNGRAARALGRPFPSGRVAKGRRWR